MIEQLRALAEIADALYRESDIRAALQTALSRLVELMALQTGWVFIVDPTATGRWYGQGFVLIAHHNLPEAMQLDREDAWLDGCECQRRCLRGGLTQGHNLVQCSRLGAVLGDRRGLAIHASAPLQAGDNLLGILNVAAPDWSAFTPETLALFENVGQQMAVALERARLLRMLEVRQARIDEELQVARQIQLSLLPGKFPNIPGWDFAASYRPARVVGGDFYDFFYLPGAPLRLGVVIADVADKGVPAAMFMAMSRTTIRTASLGGRRPAAALIRANTMILDDSHADVFLTAAYAALELNSGRVLIANAGHHRPFWWRAATGECSEFATRGMLLAAFEEIKVEEREVPLGLGDLLLFYSDGVTEAVNAAGEVFGEERLTAVLQAKSRDGAEAVVQGVLEALDEFAEGTEQSDDVTMVAVRRNPTLPAQALPEDWTQATFPSQQIPAYVRRRAV
jgi:serine phosphatase RsbU (regulator of sigma subunit)